MPAWTWRRLHKVPVQEPLAILTLDVGARVDNLEKVLDVLRDERAVATVFLYTKELAAHPRGPRVLARLVEDGHELANHTVTHADLTKLTPEQIEEEIEGVERFAQEVTGQRLMPFFREPFLATNDGVDAIVKERCYRSVWFTVDTGDWEKGMTADAIVERTLFSRGRPREIEPGSIFIFHGSQPENLRALPEVIRGLRARGLTLVSLGEALRRQPASPG